MQILLRLSVTSSLINRTFDVCIQSNKKKTVEFRLKLCVSRPKNHDAIIIFKIII